MYKKTPMPKCDFNVFLGKGVLKYVANLHEKIHAKL